MQQDNTLSIPAVIQPIAFTVTPEMALSYGQLTADFNPLHLDAEFAATTPFGVPIAHGTSFLGLVLQAVEGAIVPAYFIADVRVKFTGPVHVGQSVTARGQLEDEDAGTYSVFAETDDGKRALQGTVVVSKRPEPRQ